MENTIILFNLWTVYVLCYKFKAKFLWRTNAKDVWLWNHSYYLPNLYCFFLSRSELYEKSFPLNETEWKKYKVHVMTIIICFDVVF